MFSTYLYTDTCVCLNGGTFTGNRCVCPTGYVGLFCEQQEETASEHEECMALYKYTVAVCHLSVHRVTGNTVLLTSN